jgi:hypothetical protein
MSIPANASFVFTSYEVGIEGVRCLFVCHNPGPGQPTDYLIQCTDAEIAQVTTQAQLRDLMTTKLNRSIRRTGFAAKLDPFIGQSLTI